MLNKDTKYKYTIWWFIFFMSQIILYLGTMKIFNGFQYIWDIDKTKLSFVIMILYVIGSVYMGYRIYLQEKCPRKDHTRTDGIWFMADNLLTLGMIGTVIGFIIMLTSVFAVDLSNTSNYSVLITDMLVGMGTALWTTLVGLICSMFLKHQIVYFESVEHINA